MDLELLAGQLVILESWKDLPVWSSKPATGRKLKLEISQALWCGPIIPADREAEVRD